MKPSVAPKFNRKRPTTYFLSPKLRETLLEKLDDVSLIKIVKSRRGGNAVFYLLYALGVCIFVIVPALTKQSGFDAVLYGALFGFFCYMTYDLTNLAVVRNFPAQLAFIDIAWGSFVTAALSGFSYWVVNKVS